MGHDKLRRQVAFEAARLLWARDETELFRARMKAARRVFGGEVPRPGDLPNEREIRDQIEAMARADHRELHRGELGLQKELGPRFSPEADAPHPDRFHAYRMLLLPLEQVKETRPRYREGDVLYHSLQVFTLGRDELPCDEEFLLAALLHDVGKAIDPREHVAAALEALDGLVTPRTAWLVEHHVEALALADGTLGVRSRRRLQASEDFDELMLLARCDREGHGWGVATPDVEEALDYVRELAEMCGE